MTESRVVSIDVGGTFTDVLCRDPDGALRSFKLPSDEAELAERLFGLLGEVPAEGEALLYSTTVTLNRLLAGDLPAIGLVVTRGFRELLETARLPQPADAPADAALPPRLVGLEWVQELDARLDAAGQELRPIDSAEVARIAQFFSDAGITVVALSLLHSYLNPAHEQAFAALFARFAPAIRLLLSSAVSPQLREYERTLACALNAALVPVLESHLEHWRRPAPVPAQPLRLMQSHGGLCAAEVALEQPLGTALSGPGAAVVGMRCLAERSGYLDVITLDVGGTSTDVALIHDAQYSLRNDGEVAGYPVRSTRIDVLSIGAGGGSIARQAADRRWHVGPESAGASPGPACYGRGGMQPTLTDAQLVLGRLPTALLGGALRLDTARATAALADLGALRGFDVERTARGILEIATHHMCGAIRRISVQRGHDPAAHVLLAMGGAGPLHGAELATLLGMNEVLVPPQPGLAAAWGLQLAELMREFVSPCAVVFGQHQRADLAQRWAALENQACRWLEREGADPQAARLIYKLDLRYAGMSHETSIGCPATVPAAEREAEIVERFHDNFARLSGREWRDAEAVEIVNLRLAASCPRAGTVDLPEHSRATAAMVPPPQQAMRAVGFFASESRVESRIYWRDSLEAGCALAGPAVIEQYESTTIVPPGWTARVDRCNNLLLRRDSAAESNG